MSTLIEGGTIWSGVPGQGLKRMNILIEQGKIAAVYKCDESISEPSDLERINASGKTLVPGLINAHTHITFDAQSPKPLETMVKDGPFITLIKAVKAAKSYIRSGVTCIRDLGAMDGLDLGLRKAISEGLIVGPRMLVSGRCLCMTGGQGYQFGTEVDGTDDARRGVRVHIKNGSDVIKVMATGGVSTAAIDFDSPQLTIEEMRVIVEEAHKSGKRVAAHAHGTQGIKNAISAGVDTIEHGTFLDEEAIRMMLERRIWLIPTLSASYFRVLKGKEAGIPEFAITRSKKITESRFSSFRAARNAGVKMALGTDQGAPLNLHGSVIHEIRLMIENGCTAEEALHSATRMGADALGIGGQCGTIEVGKYADILSLDDNPLNNPNFLEKIAWVMKEGQVFYSKEAKEN